MAYPWERGKIEVCRGCGRSFYPYGPPLTEEEERHRHEMVIPHPVYPTPRETASRFRCAECMKVWDEELAAQRRKAAEDEARQDRISFYVGMGIFMAVVLWQLIARKLGFYR